MSSLPSIAAVPGLLPAEAWQALFQAQLQDAQPAAAEAAAAEPLPEAPLAAPAGLPSPPRAADAAASPWRLADPAGAVVPLTPVTLAPLAAQHGPALQWRVTDAPAWRGLFDDAGGDDADDDGAEPGAHAAPDAAGAAPVPAWALALLTRLRTAAAAPASAAALRPAVQAWRVGLPVLLASPSGLASLQASRDAALWQWRRWPARWRAARPAADERWWAVRLGLGPQGRPRTLRELGMSAPLRLAPGQVSCELRLGDVAPGVANWTAVLVQAPAAASLRALLAARPSLTWLLCSQALWPQEGP
ncbi:MAG: hypothetical protein EKK53_23105 [Burkholderiales bacterium]|nr:MAG: hypothetical protein EKK53_23105 [Burkholderiales bacterium]